MAEINLFSKKTTESYSKHSKTSPIYTALKLQKKTIQKSSYLNHIQVQQFDSIYKNKIQTNHTSPISEKNNPNTKMRTRQTRSKSFPKQKTLDCSNLQSQNIQNQKDQNFSPVQEKVSTSRYRRSKGTVKHFWSNDLAQQMLNHVSIGKSWKQIQDEKMFKVHKINNNEIKRKFETECNFKFRYLYKKHKKSSKYPNISDNIYQHLMRRDQLEKYRTDGLISLGEFQCLLDYSVLFVTNCNVDKFLIKRDKLSKNRIQQVLLKCTYPVRQYLDCILKINSIHQLVKSKKISKDNIIQQYKKYSAAESEQANDSHLTINSLEDLQSHYDLDLMRLKYDSHRRSSSLPAELSMQEIKQDETWFKRPVSMFERLLWVDDSGERELQRSLVLY